MARSATKNALAKHGKGKGGKKARAQERLSRPAHDTEPRPPTGGLAEAVLAASLGERVAESLSDALTDSINESFTEMMAGGLAKALEEAFAEIVSTTVADELPGALAAAGAGTSASAGTAATSAPSRPHGSATEPGAHAVELAAARVVWDSLPPRRLPALPGLDLAAHRLAASDPERVGGDWYDVTALTAQTVLLSIGDVAGHGTEAGALTAELCHAARAYALLGLPPAQLVSGLADLLLAGGQPALASGIAARLELPTSRLTWCNAGHPPPVLVAADGAVTFLGDLHGPLLGAAVAVTAPAPARQDGTGAHGAARYPQSAVTLPIGSTVLFYTAGLVDRAGASLAARLDALAVAAASAFAGQPTGTPAPLRAACASLLDALAGGTAAERRDSDACLLAARLA